MDFRSFASLQSVVGGFDIESNSFQHIDGLLREIAAQDSEYVYACAGFAGVFSVVGDFTIANSDVLLDVKGAHCSSSTRMFLTNNKLVPSATC